jgi:tetrahydromethanopterin S-methyltransferase subunit G
MNWKLIFSLAAFAIAMGIASVFAYTQGMELYCWIVIACICAFVLARNVTQKLFLHGLLVGIALGSVNGSVQSAFYSTYVQNNPQVAEQMSQNPLPFPPAVFVLLSSPFIGALYGVVVGLLTLLAANLRKHV